MNEKLIDLQTKKLLEKFGAGNHKPGSGSASAFQGMLSAQMLCTVIDLTVDKTRRKNYPKYSELIKIKENIKSRIYPALENLFQEDSEQFDKVITIRKARNKEQILIKKRALNEEAQNSLKVATELPLKISELCLELADFANYVFEYGFQAARGDSGVALNTAISGVLSCLSIIELNLISLPNDDWMKKTRSKKFIIREKYTQISKSVTTILDVLEQEVIENIEFQESISDFRLEKFAGTINSNSEIEILVKRLQNLLWLQRYKVWEKDAPEDPMLVLKPDVVLKKILGYIYQQTEELGTYIVEGEQLEIAGLIDKRQKIVQTSKNFPQETINFTTAHELGHAILHQQAVLHRDRPIDGSRTAPKNKEELQADKFAAYFLMPEKLLRNLFETLFEIPIFIINENTALAIRAKNIGELRQRCKDKRGLARVLASTDYYAGKSFKSLANIFGVSVETMAIRLEELNLFQY